MIKDSWGAKSMCPVPVTPGVEPWHVWELSEREDARTRLRVVNALSGTDAFLQARVFRRE